MDMKFKAAIATVLVISGNLFALMVANPVENTPLGTFRISGEYTHEMRYIDYSGSNDLKMESERLMLKPQFSVIRSTYTDIDAYGLIGTADVNLPAKSYASAYNGSAEPAFGIGFKADMNGVDLDSYGEYRLHFYMDARYLRTLSYGDINYGSITRWHTKYLWNEYNIAAIAAFEYVDWKGFVPYLGVQWMYIDGKTYRTAYIYRTDSQGQQYETSFPVQSEFFNDPGQWPKPVIGVDFKLKKGFVLSFETIFWGRKGTSLSVGISQIPYKDESE